MKVGNLVGKLEFTDDQLQQTQRGLDAAGVSMPQFGGLGKALAKEMNVEPEPEPAGAWFSPDAWQGLGLPAPIRKLLANQPRRD